MREETKYRSILSLIEKAFKALPYEDNVTNTSHKFLKA